VVKEIDRKQYVRLTLLAKTILDDLKIGDSITVNGVCLTVVSFNDQEMMMEVSPETLSATNLGALKVGDGVNLERSLRLNDRLGGHLVSGHVDGVGRIREKKVEGENYLLSIEPPQDVLRYCVKKGSIAVDGISLTINDVTEKDFTVSVIPHTAKVTTLGLKAKGDPVNLEADLIAKYVERLLHPGESKITGDKIDIEFLRKNNLL